MKNIGSGASRWAPLGPSLCGSSSMRCDNRRLRRPLLETVVAYFRAARVAGLVGSLCFAPGCYHYYVKPDRVAPATEWRSETQVAFFWGLLQPEDVAPSNCPRGVPLAEVN